MAIQIIREQATREQISEMLKVLGIYIKLAVDIEQQAIAGGGEMHYDCEQALLAEGSLHPIFGEQIEHPRQFLSAEQVQRTLNFIFKSVP